MSGDVQERLNSRADSRLKGELQRAVRDFWHKTDAQTHWRVSFAIDGEKKEVSIGALMTKIEMAIFAHRRDGARSLESERFLVRVEKFIDAAEQEESNG